MNNWSKYDNLVKSLTEAKEVLSPEELARIMHKIYGEDSKLITFHLDILSNPTLPDEKKEEIPHVL